MPLQKMFKYLKINKSLSILISLYLIFSTGTYGIWQIKNHNNVTGDEPHYLVMANGISKYFSFEQTNPYIEEFINRDIYHLGLIPEGQDPIPTPQNTHAIMGPNGLFNVHNVGLPLLLAIPYMILGVQGCKVFMILNGAFILYFIWKIISLFISNENLKFLAVLPLSISNPLVFASNQIYPELVSATISLIGIYWLVLNIKNHTSEKNIDFLTFLSISFLPWLHIKYSITLIILLFFMLITLNKNNSTFHRYFHLITPPIISCLLLLSYNYYAFGNISGPYNQWTVYGSNIQFSFKSLTVFFGLLFDQEQGIFLQNPINILGLISIGLLYRNNKVICMSIGLVSLSSIFINSIHPAWYGGYSLIGRFGWTGGIIFMIYTAYSLVRIGQINQKLLLVINSASIFISIHIFKLFTIDALNFYNLTNNPNSSRLYSYIGEYLPSWLEADKVIFHTPNFAFLFIALLFLCSGFVFIGRYQTRIKNE